MCSFSDKSTYFLPLYLCSVSHRMLLYIFCSLLYGNRNNLFIINCASTVGVYIFINRTLHDQSNKKKADILLFCERKKITLFSFLKSTIYTYLPQNIKFSSHDVAGCYLNSDLRCV